MSLKFIRDKKVKNHSKNEIKPLKIMPKSKTNGFNDISGGEKLVDQIATKNVFPYLFLHLTKFCEEEKLTFKQVLLLLYLNELQIFNHKINLIDGEYQVTKISEYGFIETDFTYKKTNYWCLSDKGKNVVKRFYDQIGTNNSLLVMNRQTEMDVESKVKSTLSTLFK